MHSLRHLLLNMLKPLQEAPATVGSLQIWILANGNSTWLQEFNNKWSKSFQKLKMGLLKTVNRYQDLYSLILRNLARCKKKKSCSSKISLGWKRIHCVSRRNLKARLLGYLESYNVLQSTTTVAVSLPVLPVTGPGPDIQPQAGCLVDNWQQSQTLDRMK